MAVSAFLERSAPAIPEDPVEAPPLEIPSLTDELIDPPIADEFEHLTDGDLDPFELDRPEPVEAVVPAAFDHNPHDILEDPELPVTRTAEPQQEVTSLEPPEDVTLDAPEKAPVERPLEPQPVPVVDTPEAPEADATPARVAPSPRISDCPPPIYPRLAARRGWTGTVVLLISVAKDGSVTDVKIESTSGHDILDKAAVKAVKVWRFHPGSLGGEPAALLVRKPIRFGS